MNHLSTVHTMCAIILSCLPRWCLQYKSQRITVRLHEVLASKVIISFGLRLVSQSALGREVPGNEIKSLEYN